MQKKASFVVALCLWLSMFFASANIAEGVPEPVGVSGTVTFNGEPVEDGVHVTVYSANGSKYDNCTTSNGAYASSFSLSDGDVVQVNVSYMGCTASNETSIYGPNNYCNVSISSSGGNNPPVVDVPDSISVYEGESLYLDASDCYDIDGEITSYSWNIVGYGSGVTLEGENVSRVYNDEVSLVVYLTVTDDDNDDTTGVIDVEIENKPPIANLSVSPSSGNVNETFTFSANSSSDTADDELFYSWDVDDDGVYEYDYTSDSYRSLSFENPGNHTVSLFLEDEDGASDTGTKTVYVSNTTDDDDEDNDDNDEDNDNDNDTDNETDGQNVAPVVNFSFTGDTVEGGTISLSSNSYDPDGLIANYTWNIAGFIRYGENTSYTFRNNGNRTIRLTVIDNNGSENYTEEEIVVDAQDEGMEDTGGSLRIATPSGDVDVSVENTETGEIVYSGSGSDIYVEDIENGSYTIFCKEGNEQWSENVTIHGYTEHAVNSPSSNNDTPAFSLAAYLLAVAFCVVLWRRKHER